MKLKTTFIGFLLLGILGCSDSDADFKLSKSNLNGTWRVISFEDLETGTIELKTQENSGGKDIILTFDDTKNPHKLSGVTPANWIEGEFEYTGEKKFKMGYLRTTLVAGPEWDNKFYLFFPNEGTFEIDSNQLVIYHKDKTKRVTLTKH